MATKLHRQIGYALAQELIQEALTSSRLPSDTGLTQEVVNKITSVFEPITSSCGSAARDGRGDWDYWLDHGDSTGALMRYMAQTWGGDPDLYNWVGCIHDLDYLLFPHDAPRSESNVECVHPVPLARTMREFGIHPIITLAVLEHAPYLGLAHPSSSRLSAMLSAAEDLATLAALEPPCTNLDSLSEEAQALFGMVVVRKRIHHEEKVRVEGNLQRFINEPLALITGGFAFQFDL